MTISYYLLVFQRRILSSTAYLFGYRCSAPPPYTAGYVPEHRKFTTSPAIILKGALGFETGQMIIRLRELVHKVKSRLGGRDSFIQLSDLSLKYHSSGHCLYPEVPAGL